jgi:glycosyltransferase involved in cell wall biosynthesis
MKIALVARGCNTGLGTMSWEFARHLKPHKTLVIRMHKKRPYFPDRFGTVGKNVRVCPVGQMPEGDMDWLLAGTDLLLTIETPYQWALYKKAKRENVKTIMIPMYEGLPSVVPYDPDLYVCPSEIDMDYVGDKPKVLLPCPIALDRLPYRKRQKAKVFVFHNGRGGGRGGDRNGAKEFFQALKYVKSDIKVIVYTQVAIEEKMDSRVELRYGNFKNYWDIWEDGDVFVHPHKFDGLSLPIQEAVACGMPVITTKFYPFTEWLPDEWMFEPNPSEEAVIFTRKIPYYTFDPKVLAKKIDEFAARDISKDSDKAIEIARSRSWEKLLPKYLKEFEKLCNI